MAFRGEPFGRNLLVHVCCGPCLYSVLEALRAEHPGGFACLFDNPNIHPLIEFRRRLKTFRIVCDAEGLHCFANEAYELREFLDAVDYRSAERRCLDCYRLRLERTAARARQEGFDAFTTTLLASTHQKHEAIRDIGEEVERDTGVKFVYRDWRGLSEDGRREARRRHLYLQQYCGCIFSEQQRYAPTTLHLYGERPSTLPPAVGRGKVRAKGPRRKEQG